MPKDYLGREPGDPNYGRRPPGEAGRQRRYYEKRGVVKKQFRVKKVRSAIVSGPLKPHPGRRATYSRYYREKGEYRCPDCRINFATFKEAHRHSSRTGHELRQMAEP